MEQLINTMLANTQIPQIPQPGKKGDSAGQKDGFQKLLEQKADASPASKPERRLPSAPATSGNRPSARRNRPSSPAGESEESACLPAWC